MKTWDYAESIESSAIVNIEKKYGIFLDGEFQTANSKKFLKTIFPSSISISLDSDNPQLSRIVSKSTASSIFQSPI